MVTVGDIIEALEEVAPLSLQELYDNAGLLTGARDMEARAVLVCVDVTEEVIDDALSKGANLIVSHHPLVFKPLKSFTGSNYIEKTLIKALKNDIAIYSCHTNMDNAWNGVNFKMAEMLGLFNLSVLSPVAHSLLKLVTYVPTDKADELRRALFAAGAGTIGNYDCCSYNSEGFGTFRAGENTQPYCGEIGVLHEEKETRIEMVVPRHLQARVTRTLLQVHPYEEPAFDWIPIENKWERVGSGVVGELLCPMDEMDFLQRVKSIFKAGCVKHTSLTGRKIRQVALCGGAGSFLIPQAVAQGVDAFVTGEIKYHEFFGNEESILLAEIGHYESEQYTKDVFCDIITKKFPTFACYYTMVETNPINYL